MSAPNISNDTLHIILTRFNVRSGGREQNLREQPDWLRQRFDLFDRFCFPSVQAQSNREFRWLVFFDVHTPDQFKQRIREYQTAYPPFTPVFTDGWSTAIVHAAIKEHASSSHKFLLTTRLDNDDGIHAEFISTLRTCITTTETSYYNFSNGLIYNEGRIFQHQDQSNAFASYFEPISDFATVWKMQHHLIASSNGVCQLPMRNAWLQVVHGTNVSNRVKGQRVSTRVLQNGYSHLSKIQVSNESWWDWQSERVLFSPARRTRERLIRLIKPLVRKQKV